MSSFVHIALTLWLASILRVAAFPINLMSAVPQTVVIDGLSMLEARLRLRFRKEDEALERTLSLLTTDADAWLTQGPWTVVDKPYPPPGGGIHDYLSQAPYVWPTQNKTNDNPYGCPYVERDGLRNPDVDAVTDRPKIGNVCSSVPSLAFAWYYTRNAAYAEHAANIVRTWFLDPATRMNPNLNHGQVIPCENSGRAIGIIDFSQMYTTVLDAVAILNTGAPGWTKEDAKAMTQWNKEFLAWHLESEFGKTEAATANNHGTFSDMQIAALALFVGDKDLAKATVENARSLRIDTQISGDGSLPLELERTRSFHYSSFTLVAFTRLAAIGKKVGVDLWSYVGPDGQSIQKAVDYILPAATGKTRWAHPELGFKRYAASDVVRAAADAGNERAKKAVSRLETPPKGDLWSLRPAAEQLDSLAG